MVSSAVISRRDITREECVRLDAYVNQHRLGEANVVLAFERKDSYVNGVSPDVLVAQAQSVYGESAAEYHQSQ